VRVSALLAAFVALSCTNAAGPTFPTSARFPNAPRRAPTFAPEPFSVGPAESGPVLLASAEPRRLVAPVDSDAARDLVSRFFGAVLLESTRELFPLLGSQATLLSEGSRQPAQSAWRARFAQLDYTTLAGRLLSTPQTLRSYTFASAERARRDGVPAPQAPNEVVVVARPGLVWTGKTRLFGDQLAFRVKPKSDEPGYEITEIAEDFRLP
jgi:hypothetical protein